MNKEPIVPTGQLRQIKRRIDAVEKRLSELEAKRPILGLKNKK